MSVGRRIFIAVALAAPLREAIAALERRLEEAGTRVRWVRPENLHFTLRFLGHISEVQLDRARVAARETARGAAPFAVGLRGLGAFPSLARPQVVWVGVGEGADALRDLAARLEEALAGQRFPREPRPYQPHLTLARVKEARLWGDVGRAVARYEGVEVGHQDVASLLVMESLLRPQGPTYAPVEEVPFSPYEK